jgi:glycosyltransferase involved in cell wall biosynthesis
MAVYYKETPNNLNQCLESLANQTLRASEIIIVKDGNLSEELEEVLEIWQRKLPLKIVGYKMNMGLAYALNYGIQQCSYELIARMDSDDICLPDRFEKQVEVFNMIDGIDIASGYITEFVHCPEHPYAIRKVPLTYKDIIKYSKRRSPFNHVAVMYKKQVVLNCGGYSFRYLEDYDLWLNILKSGYKAMNIPDILVNVRTGNDMIGRRHGVIYAKNEYLLLKKYFQNGYFNLIEYILNCIIRLPVRFLPKILLALVYKINRFKI